MGEFYEAFVLWNLIILMPLFASCFLESYCFWPPYYKESIKPRYSWSKPIHFKVNPFSFLLPRYVTSWNVFIPCFFNFAFLYIAEVFWDCRKRSCNGRACGHTSTPSFGSHLNPNPTRGGCRLCPPCTDIPTNFWKQQACLCKQKTMLLEELFRTNTKRRDYQIIPCYLENRSVRENL